MKAEEIKALREKLELSQQEFSERVGVSLGTICRWENGHSTPHSKAHKRALEAIRES
jgi:DNA-binding transcriptional regulator YiaG